MQNRNDQELIIRESIKGSHEPCTTDPSGLCGGQKRLYEFNGEDQLNVAK